MKTMINDREEDDRRNIAFVITLSLVSPYQPWPSSAAASAAGANVEQRHREDRQHGHDPGAAHHRCKPYRMRRPQRSPRARRPRSPGADAGLVLVASPSDLDVADRRLEHRCARSGRRELALLGAADQLVARRHHDRRPAPAAVAEPRPRVETAELAPGLGDVAGGVPRQLGLKPDRLLGSR